MKDLSGEMPEKRNQLMELWQKWEDDYRIQPDYDNNELAK